MEYCKENKGMQNVRNYAYKSKKWLSFEEWIFWGGNWMRQIINKTDWYPSASFSSSVRSLNFQKYWDTYKIKFEDVSGHFLLAFHSYLMDSGASERKPNGWDRVEIVFRRRAEMQITWFNLYSLIHCIFQTCSHLHHPRATECWKNRRELCRNFWSVFTWRVSLDLHQRSLMTKRMQ